MNLTSGYLIQENSIRRKSVPTTPTPVFPIQPTPPFPTLWPLTRYRRQIQQKVVVRELEGLGVDAVSNIY